MARDIQQEAASELRWYFRWSGADVGFKAQGYASGGGHRQEADTTTDRQVNAASKAKRIRRGLALCAPEVQATVRLAFEGHGRANAVLVALGDVAELVRVDPAARAMWHGSEARAVAEAKRTGGKRTVHPFDEWLADSCAAGKAGVAKLRDAAEARLAAAVALYASVRVPPGKGHREPPDVPKDAPRGPYGPRKGKVAEAAEAPAIRDDWEGYGL